MCIKNLFRFAFESISRRWFISFIVICLFMVSLYSIGIMSYTQELTNYGHRTMNKTLRSDIAHTGIIGINSEQFNEENLEKLSELQKELYESPEIENVGEYAIFAAEYEEMEELTKIQKENTKVIGNLEGFEFLSISMELTNLCQVEFPQYDMPQTDGDESYKMYLGSNFKDIPVGTVYNCVLSDGYTISYVVAGILQEGARWIGEDIIYENEPMQLDYTYSLDNMAVVIQDGCMSNTWIYTRADEANSDDVREKITAVADKYGIDLDFADLEKFFEKKESNNMTVKSNIENFFRFYTIAVIAIMLCIQLSNMISRSREYGIMYANGMGTRDLLCITVLENILKILLGFVLTIGALKFEMHTHYASLGEYWESMANKILMECALGKIFFVMLILLVVISVIPVYMICRMKTVELIGGNRE